MLKSLVGSVLLFCAGTIQSDIRISARSIIDGRPLSAVVVGVPFVIDVEISGYQGTVSVPEFVEASTALQRTGFRMSSINGMSSVQYSYQTRVDAPGVYRYGPARIAIEGVIEESNRITLAASKGDATEHRSSKRKRNNHDESVVARMAVNKDRVVVGERIEVTLRFYRSSGTIDFQSVHEPAINAALGIEIKNRKEATQGREIINDQLYDYLEWTFDCMPTKSGEIIIPAYSFEYSKRSDRFDIFSALFGSATVHTLYSNPVSIIVDPLPQTHKSVDGIGLCKQIRAYLEPAIIDQHDGSSLIIELVGDLDIEQFKLFNMPSELRVYDGNKKVAAHDKEMKRYTFDYVLQATEAGKFQIPSQTFTLFDTDKREYVTLRTDSLTLIVNPSATHQDPSSNQGGSQQEGGADASDQRSLAPLAKTFGSPREHLMIPWKLFWIIVGIVAFWGLLPFRRFITFALRDYFFVYHSALHRFIATRSARTALHKTQKKNEPAQVYTIFEHWFTRMIARESTQNVLNAVDERVKTALGDEELHSWKRFVTQMQEARFFHDEITPDAHTAFFNAAHSWIKKLKDII